MVWKEARRFFQVSLPVAQLSLKEETWTHAPSPPVARFP